MSNGVIYLPFSRLPTEQFFLLLRGDRVELPRCEAALCSTSWSLCWWGLNDWSVYRAVCWHKSTVEESDVLWVPVGCTVQCWHHSDWSSEKQSCVAVDVKGLTCLRVINMTSLAWCLLAVILWEFPHQWTSWVWSFGWVTTDQGSWSREGWAATSHRVLLSQCSTILPWQQHCPTPVLSYLLCYLSTFHPEILACSVSASCFQSHNSTGGQIFSSGFIKEATSTWSPESLIWHGENTGRG